VCLTNPGIPYTVNTHAKNYTLVYEFGFMRHIPSKRADYIKKTAQEGVARKPRRTGRGLQADAAVPELDLDRLALERAPRHLTVATSRRSAEARSRPMAPSLALCQRLLPVLPLCVRSVVGPMRVWCFLLLAAALEITVWPWHLTLRLERRQVHSLEAHARNRKLRWAADTLMASACLHVDVVYRGAGDLQGVRQVTCQKFIQGYHLRRVRCNSIADCVTVMTYRHRRSP
jgi:hypothetical protein